MKNEPFYDNNLENLFQNARIQEPVYAFSETQTAFIAGSAAGISTFAAAKILGSSIFKFKFLIMTITSITILASAVLLFNTATLEAKESFTAKHEQSLMTNQFQQSTLRVEPLISNLENLPISSALPINTLILNALITKPIPPYNLNPEFKPMTGSKITLENDTVRVSYFITENTTLSELNAIKLEAKNAGVNMLFYAKIKHHKLKKLEYTLRVDGFPGFKSAKVAPFRNVKYFQHEIFWKTNGAGEFLNFGKPVLSHTVCSSKPITEKSLTKIEAKNEKTEESTEQFTTEVTSLGQDPKVSLENIMLNRKTEGKSWVVSHIISSKSTEDDILEIQKEALDAGVEFEYKGKFKRGSIRSLSITMYITNPEGERLRSVYYIVPGRNESFSNAIIWRHDEAGNALDFGSPKQVVYH